MKIKGILLKIAVMILSFVVREVSPMIRNQIASFLAGLYVEAKKTENPFDELLVETLYRIFDLPLPQRKELESHE